MAAIRNEADAHAALSASRGLSCTAWRKPRIAIPHARWPFWLALSLTALLAVGVWS